jgi:hypothetical protein
MISDWVTFLPHPNLFGIKGFVDVVVIVVVVKLRRFLEVLQK